MLISPFGRGLHGQNKESAMAQPVRAILSHQDELAAQARRHTGDVNEAGLLVGKVVSRAFLKFDQDEPEDVITAAMRRDLDVLIAERAS
jgi:hypothetical protein